MGYKFTIDKSMHSLNLIAVPEYDCHLFSVALREYNESCHGNGDVAIEMGIVRSYPDIEYKLARDVVAMFGHNLFCVNYSGTYPGFTDRRSIFLKNLERDAPDFRPFWSAAHELCHLFENIPQIYLPALESLKKLLFVDAVKMRRAIEDDDVGKKFRAFLKGTDLIEVDESPERMAYIWREVMADCYASMWSKMCFWDDVERLHVTENSMEGFAGMIEIIRETNNVTAITSYPARTWYPPENRYKVRNIMTELTVAFLMRNK